jgi:hypothetical protein
MDAAQSPEVQRVPLEQLALRIKVGISRVLDCAA